MPPAHVLQLGRVPYAAAWDLQRAIAGDVAAGDRPDTILLLEHPPVITLGRRAEPGELHVPPGVDLDVVETNRGGKSTYHGPGQLVCYPIVDLQRHGSDIKRYVRLLERALIETVGAFGIEATRFDGDNMAGVWLPATRPGVTAGGLARGTARTDPPNGGTPPLPPRKIA